MRWLTIALVLTLSACGSETDTGKASACTAKLYSSYNPRNIDQCINVCVTCEKGVVTTCSTSCRMKGAS